MSLPPALRHRDFNLYWFGVVFSEIGTRGTVAANLYQVYALTHSVFMTGFVGLAQAVALLVLSPIGGAYADRLDRRRLLQVSQVVALLVAGALAALTISGSVRTWEILLSVLGTTAAATFGQPARLALIPAMVPRAELPQAFALLNPSRELAVLIGPAVAGVLIAARGPGLMYAVDTATYAVLIAALGMLRIPKVASPHRHQSVRSNILQGISFVRARPLIWLMMSLDLSATLFGAYRVVLPALADTVFHVGPTGYGLLSSAPSAGALLATYGIFRIVGRRPALGRVLLVASMAYGVAVMALAQARLFPLALLAGVLIGAADAMATTIRQAAIQLETPDDLRGRVSSIYQMASRGGPALGDVNLGWIAGLLGPVSALTLGGAVPLVYAGVQLFGSGRVKSYTTDDQDRDEPGAVASTTDQIREPALSADSPADDVPRPTAPS